jgi:hypothetical protein
MLIWLHLKPIPVHSLIDRENTESCDNLVTVIVLTISKKGQTADFFLDECSFVLSAMAT